jgi:hypothetical protein
MDMYNVELRASITRRTQEGGYYGERLEVNETINLNAETFLELSSILAKFHDLMQTLKKENPAR